MGKYSYIFIHFINYFMGSAVKILKRTREVMKRFSLLLCFLLGAGQLRFHKENLL